jgi:protein-serine/threonine kinase
MQRPQGKDAPTLDDFQLLKVIGKGSYGKVMLVKCEKAGGAVFAMKMLRKENVVKRNQVEHTRAERNVLETAQHPFIVNLMYAFQTPKKLYFVLEFCPGGELFFHLSRNGRFSEGRTRFYTSELLLAIGYMHSLNIIYRDLKPENVLLDAVGHAKLTDFGLSKEGVEDNFSAKSMCGTPEYLAPEILDKKGHGKAVDWYSLGALTYEMLTGLPPYYTRDREKLFDRIRRAELSYPTYVTANAQDLLKKMLLRNPDQRLGGGANGQEDIKANSFFAGTDWAAVMSKSIPPPFTPSCSADGGVPKYVDKEFLDMPVANSEVGGGADVAHFEGFTYKAPS